MTTSSKIPLRPLHEVATIERDAIAAAAIIDGTIYIGLEHIDSDGQFISAQEVRAGELASNKFRFGPRHLLFGKLRPYLRKTARPDFEGICSTDIVPILPGPEVDRDYLFHYLRHPKTVEQAVLRCAGANLPRLSPRDLATFEVPVPPLPEQRRIADILDKADTIRRKRKKAIALTEELLRSAFLEMFGDPVTNPKGWPVKPLSQIVREGTIVTYGIVQAGPHVDGGIPYIRTGDIKDNRIIVESLLRTSPEIASRFRRSEVRAGDIIMSIRATVGTAALVPPSLDGANLTQGTARIAPGRDVTREFLFEHIRAPGMQRWFQGRVKGATFKEITLGELRTAPIMVPPRSLQERFSTLAVSIQKTIENHEQAERDASDLFAALAHHVFIAKH